MSNIKHNKGKVTFVMRTGKTFVRNEMALAYAKAIVKRSKNVKETDKRGYGMEICVDDKYFFPIDKPVEPKSDEVTKDE
jgi:hypothetical protein